MWNGLARWLWDPSGLTPHGFCLLWQPGLIWTYALSDLAIGISYFTIPLALAIVARRRRDLLFRPLFLLFAAFILLCGCTHFLDVLTLWHAAYGVEAVVKVATALVSAVTAVLLWRLLPEALALPSPEQLRIVNAALRESEARHRTGFENSPVPLHTLDSGGTIRAVSKSWLSLLGYAEDEVIGRHIQDFAAPNAPLWVGEAIATLKAEGQIRDMPRRLRRRDGALVDVLISARLEARDAFAAIVCVTIDITDRKRTEAALHASEERLRHAQKIEAVGQLTGGIAHDFNNTLQGIGGCLELTERRIAQGRGAEASRYIAAARQSVERAAALTQRMLAFARRQALQPVVVRPETLVRGMEELLRSTLGPAILIDARLDDSMWLALCDANQLESALLNLTINARDAMPAGGRLTIAIADRPLTEADVLDETEAKPGDYVELAISDTGTGMAADVAERVFEPFFTTKPIGQGTGLGLSQIYGFVQQSGGFVRLESAPGEGTTIRLYLPRHDQPPAPASAAAIPPPPVGDRGVHPAGRGRRVLVVDDESDVRSVIVEVLKDLGCIVTEASDGPGGLVALRTAWAGTRFDMLVSDVGLPGLTGRQLAEAAREMDAALPILLVTGYGEAALLDADRPSGVELLRKPFAIDAFAARIIAMLEGCRSPDGDHGLEPDRLRVIARAIEPQT
jgi:PAS domain S-box-containing protein